jgi:adenylate cyclase
MFLSPLLPMAAPLIVMTALSLLKYGIEVRKVRQRNRDLVDAQDTIIISMSTLTEARDRESGQHILRTQHYVEVLARQLATLPRYAALDEASIELLAKSAPLHDIGKVGIPDYILRKPGALTAEEYDIMKTHTLIGSQALSKTIGGTEHPEKLEFLNYALQMAESHHEKWDGSGYPRGLSGSDIPLAGRLMALADAYDALISKRVYKRDFSHEEAREQILAGAGTHFDPDVVAAFMAQSGEFIRIAREFADEDEGGRLLKT